MLAHGVGGREDLPIPFSYVLIGAAAALLVSFAVLGLRWRESRLGVAHTDDRPLPAPIRRLLDSTGWAWTLRLVGLVAAGYLLIGLIFGRDTADNPTAGLVYLLFWVGLVPLSLLFGPVWRALNPLRTVHLLCCLALRRDPVDGAGRELPTRWGYWPATAGLLAFVWLELVAPERASTRVIGIWLAAYAVATLAGAAVHGARWFDRGDAFEVYSDLVGRLSIVGRRPDGVLAWRNPLDGMSGLRPAPGLVAVVAVLLGSTLFDSLSNAPAWLRFRQENGLPEIVTGTGGLLGTIGLVLVAYTWCTALAGRLGRTDPRPIPGELAHSIVPIAVGYVIAHYYSLLVLEGQRTLALLSDPLVTGDSDWLGTAGWRPHTGLITPDGVATVQVTVIVLGHLLGTVLAHDRTLALLPRHRVVLGQLPLLTLMVAYTVTGLLLLFTG